jgi:hypothetical protein
VLSVGGARAPRPEQIQEPRLLYTVAILDTLGAAVGVAVPEKM